MGRENCDKGKGLMLTADRFWDKITILDKETCWPWRGAKTNDGYGLFWPERRTTRTAHSFMYQIWYSDYDPSLEVHHICANRECVNPYHLQQLTGKENTRQQTKVTSDHCHYGHKWTP